jgi:cytidylate kinase
MIPHTYLEHTLSVLRTRLKTTGSHQPGSAFREHNPFITLSRETAAGATTIGQELVTLLNQEIESDAQGWMFLDKDLLTQALLHHQLPAQLAAYLPEDRISETQAVIGELVGLHPSLWQLEQKIAESILQLAHVGHVIFVGRGAHLITRTLPAGLHVRLVASMQTRIHRMSAALKCPPDDAFRHIERQDLARRRFVRSHFDSDLEDPHQYAMVLNTDHLTPTAAARTIVAALREHAKSRCATPAIATAATA